MKNNYKLHCYQWSGYTSQNKKSSGEVRAISINFAKVTLMQQGIRLSSIRKNRIQLLNKFTRKISSLDIALFFRQLATLISAGVPILQSCETLHQSEEKLPLKSLIHTLKNEIAAGKSFTAGLKKFPHYFNNLSCHLLEAGEQSGTLEIMLNRVANYHEKLLHLKKQIKQALFYPALVSMVAIAITLIMLIFVIPRFEELFQTMQGALPAFTVAIISISKLLRNNAWILLLPITTFFIAFYFYQKNTQTKQFIDHILLKLPGLRTLFQKSILARFTRSLAILFNSGIPITEALTISANTSDNHIYIQAIHSLQNEVASGQQLHTAMLNNPLFPPMTIQMIKVGEESGALDKMLEKIADLYESDIDHMISNLSHLLEPLIMVVLGVLIGGLVIGMYLPIFKLGMVI